MRVLLDNGRKSVDIDVNDNYGENFLANVRKALLALGYSELEIMVGLSGVDGKKADVE